MEALQRLHWLLAPDAMIGPGRRGTPQAVIPRCTRFCWCALVLVAFGCGSTNSRADGSSIALDGGTPSDAGRDGGDIDDATTSDVATPDGGQCDPGRDAGMTFTQAGYCFVRTPACCADADCASDVCLENGHCLADTMPCGCSRDDHCQLGQLCFVNERFCGVCLPERPRCTGADCLAGEDCIDGRCTDLTRCRSE